MAIRILGIDPGFDRLGVCVVEKDGAKETLLFSTCVTTSKKDAFGDRLVAIGRELESIIDTYKPSELAIEKLFLAVNQKTVMSVAEVRGVIVYVSHLKGLTMFEYSPPEIKVAITGYGKASKDDIALMVPKILKTPAMKLIDDEMDAIAIALTHSAHRKMASWKE